MAVDAAAKQVKVKTDKGEEVTVPLQDQTSFLRMPPGEKDLGKATRIQLKDIGVGDRVLARAKPLEGGGLSPAASLIVMTKADLAEFHEKSREEWEKRGTVGTVASLDPATKAITITVPSGLTPKDTKSVIVDPSDKLVYRRYAPGSAKFAGRQGKYIRQRLRLATASASWGIRRKTDRISKRKRSSPALSALWRRPLFRSIPRPTRLK